MDAELIYGLKVQNKSEQGNALLIKGKCIIRFLLSVGMTVNKECARAVQAAATSLLVTLFLPKKRLSSRMECNEMRELKLRHFSFDVSLLFISGFALFSGCQKANPFGSEDEFLSVIAQPQMVFVEGGTFTMGCTDEQNGDCKNTEIPSHQVTLSNFRIGKYEITRTQWQAVMDYHSNEFFGYNNPVETISWNDIVGTSGDTMVIKGIIYYENGYIYKLNQLTGKQYRLPTEAEWEYAARGGKKSQGYKYSGSNDVNEVAWYENNSGETTHPVGRKQANELGIYDMSGNVWEWCSNWFGNYTANAKVNPAGPVSGSERVIRGGCWRHTAINSRVSSRNRSVPDKKWTNVGLRLAMSETDSTNLEKFNIVDTEWVGTFNEYAGGLYWKDVIITLQFTTDSNVKRTEVGQGGHWDQYGYKEYQINNQQNCNYTFSPDSFEGYITYLNNTSKFEIRNNNTELFWGMSYERIK